MTKTQSLVSRVLLFFTGAGVVLLSFFLLTAGKELTKSDAFIWIMAGVMYLAFWTPFFFSYITIGNFSVKIPRFGLVWLGIILYIAATAAVIALLGSKIIPFNAAVIAESVLFFFFAIDIYLAFFATQHIVNVAAEDKAKLACLTEIKNNARLAAIAVQNLPAQFESGQKILISVFEEIKYISPAAGAEELETRIISALSHVQELCDAAAGGGVPSGLDSAARNLQTLVKQRKLLKN